MKKKLIKNFIMFLVSLMLVLILIIASSLGWFHRAQRNILGEFKLDVVRFNFTVDSKQINTDYTITKTNLWSTGFLYGVNPDYNGIGIAPGYYGRHRFLVSNEGSTFSANYSLKISIEESYYPTTMYLYNEFWGEGQPLPEIGGAWHNAHCISAPNYILKEGLLTSGQTQTFELVFYWPYLAYDDPSSQAFVNSIDTLYGGFENPDNFKIVVNVFAEEIR